MKKRISLSISLVLGILLLSGCGAGEKLTPTTANETSNYNGTLSIGDKIYDNFYSYHYDGIVGDSVVVSVDEYRTLHIPIETKEWVTLPYSDEGIKIRIKNVNKDKGTIDIELIEKNQN